jgi:hypothetical protein
MPRLGFTGHFKKITIDRTKFTATMKATAEVVQREAIREWLRAVIVGVPVWTGMSMGALKYARGRSGDSAGQFLSSYLRVAVPIGPWRTWDGEALEIRSDKSPELGGRQSRYTISQYRGRYLFTFQTSVIQFIINDLYPGKPPSYTRPWQAIQAGNEAFQAYLNANLRKRLPKIKDFVVTSDVIVPS